MSWINNQQPPKINRNENGVARKSSLPEGLWSKCPSCEEVLYATDLEKNANVCPKCAHHNRLDARARIDLLLDAEGRFEIGAEVLPVDSLKFKDSRRYTERLLDATETTGETDSLVVVQGELKTLPVVVLTSSREETDLAISWNLGVNAYVVKPVDSEQFFHALKTLGRFWAVLNETPDG